MLGRSSAEPIRSFVRCDNSQQVPESMCTACFHTLVARNLVALEHAEARHRCAAKHETARGRGLSAPLFSFLTSLLTS